MSDDQRTALVVLHPGTDAAAPADRMGEIPPPAGHVDTVLAWFRERGFETGPVVGISFAITGSPELAGEVFGGTSAMAEGGAGELPLDALSDDVASLVAAVVVSPPPDFGPGNP